MAAPGGRRQYQSPASIGTIPGPALPSVELSAVGAWCSFECSPTRRKHRSRVPAGRCSHPSPTGPLFSSCGSSRAAVGSRCHSCHPRDRHDMVPRDGRSPPWQDGNVAPAAHASRAAVVPVLQSLPLSRSEGGHDINQPSGMRPHGKSTHA
jgi:hypothetical protein